MTNERRAELMRAMQGEPDDQAVLFIIGWGAPEITCGELRALLTSAPANVRAIVAGALFDFLGYLTTLDVPVTMSGAHDAARPLEIMDAWAKTRGLTLNTMDVYVQDWQTRLDAPPPAPERTPPDTCDDLCMIPVDPIAAAVDGFLEPIGDELKALGHKLEEQNGDETK